jgi:hypothetical protein
MLLFQFETIPALAAARAMQPEPLAVGKAASPVICCCTVGAASSASIGEVGRGEGDAAPVTVENKACPTAARALSLSPG